MGYQIASVGLSPVFAVQARRVRRSASRLSEPPGPRSGTDGVGPALRLLILGDSAAAGVGAASQADALSGRLVARLAPAFRVTWTLVARIGATTAGTTRHLVRRTGDQPEAFDVAVVSLGANDATSRRPLDRWLEDLDAIVALLRRQYGVRHVLLSGLPPLHLFPGFPQPLRWYLGATARRFDDELARWSADQPDCEHVPLRVDDATGMLAPDGIHPGPLAYERWGALLAQRIRARHARP
jgi:lysophospholipase L1-like esterase